MIYNIQILRGLAALWVVFHHSLVHFSKMNLSFAPFEWLAFYGFVGVDVFFVISGLVMAKTTENLNPGFSSTKKFLSKRFARIFLGYWPILMITCLIIWLLKPSLFEGKDIVGSIFLLKINMFELILPQAWSLPFELYFYFLVALIILFNITRIDYFFLSLTVLIVIKLISIDFGISYALDLLFSHMIFEFIFGYYLWVYRNSLIKLSWLFWIGITAISFFIGAYFELVGTMWRALTFGGFSLGIVALAIKLENKPHQSIIRILKPIGDSSYTLYLLHFSLFVIFYQSGLRTFLVDSGLAAVGFISYLMLMIILSYFLYRVLEKPLYLKVSKKINQG